MILKYNTLSYTNPLFAIKVPKYFSMTKVFARDRIFILWRPYAVNHSTVISN